jgi:post-segregation antitoxin (ccd killing protein)
MTPRNDIKREATSIKVDPQLWKQAKIEAIRNDLELSELVEQAIEKWIEDEAHKRVKGERK